MFVRDKPRQVKKCFLKKNEVKASIPGFIKKFLSPRVYPGSFLFTTSLNACCSGNWGPFQRNQHLSIRGGSKK